MATKFHIDKSTTWWVTTPAQRKKSNSKFAQDFVDFIRHISLHCYSRMVDVSFGFWEKVIWFFVHVVAGCLLIVFLSDAWEAFVKEYFAITLYEPLYPVELVAFPAVTICSNNRISRRAAEQYAQQLSKIDPEKRNTTFFMDRIQYLSFLYTRETVVETPDLLQFQQYLDLHDTLDNESDFNTLKKMRMLAPRCEDILLNCSLSGEPVDCISNKTFKTILTSSGYCCSFNSNNLYKSRTAANRFASPELGLTVILNTSSNDMHAPLLRIDGTSVMIHSPSKFPEGSSGGSVETFIINGLDNYLSLSPHIVDSVPTLRQFSPKTRNCFFDDESPNLYKLGGNYYSLNNCISRCRIRSILVLCKCLPFNMPFELAPNGTRTVYCTLQHLECLLRYRFKWRNVLVKRETIPGLEREIEDALFCPYCLPSCNNIVYKTRLKTLPVSTTLEDVQRSRPEDVTVLRVYFDEPYTKYYRQIVRNSWFEAFSTIGNYCGIIIGFSLAAMCEVVYFIARQIALALKQGQQNGHQALTIYP